MRAGNIFFKESWHAHVETTGDVTQRVTQFRTHACRNHCLHCSPMMQNFSINFPSSRRTPPRRQKHSDETDHTTTPRSSRYCTYQPSLMAPKLINSRNFEIPCLTRLTRTSTIPSWCPWLFGGCPSSERTQSQFPCASLPVGGQESGASAAQPPGESCSGRKS